MREVEEKLEDNIDRNNVQDMKGSYSYPTEQFIVQFPISRNG